MAVGIITGSGSYALPELDGAHATEVSTRWGAATVTAGRLAGEEVLHVSRHGDGHVRLSNHVAHRANIAALRDSGASCILATTVCGAVDASVALGSLVVFDDLHFLGNRLADGSLCTLYDTAGEEGRGHWILEEPYAPALRDALLAGARERGHETRDGGCYGHVDGPRFNTRAEIRGLAICGVTAVSQTAGPETVLAGEAQIPYALVGYATDYANGVQDEPTPVEELMRLIGESGATFAAVLAAAVPLAARASAGPVGTVFRF